MMEMSDSDLGAEAKPDMEPAESARFHPQEDLLLEDLLSRVSAKPRMPEDLYATVL
jgi:type III secretion system FlhB-like substrate exporter